MSFDGRKSIFSPFSFWKNFFKAPTTIRYPKEDLDVFDTPGASPFYRGLHTNDQDKCIGCGTCEDICPTAAITMLDRERNEEGKLNKTPNIDYGHCCFCGFCVDVCPSGSLNMSRDYIYTYRTPITDFGDIKVTNISNYFKVTPDATHGDNIGYSTPDELSWLDLKREEMPQLRAEERYDSFIEIVKGFSREQALKEASRCIECGVCKETCPANMQIPEYIKAIWDDDLEESVRQIYLNNPLPNVCGRVCTHKCETVCAIHHRGDAIAIRWLKRYAVDNIALDQIEKIAGKEICKKNGKKVAIIGSGPAGLSAAYYLVLLGYEITVYEKAEREGGVMRYGIPRYRLPHEALDKDVTVLKALGVTIKTGVTVGEDIAIDAIKKQYDAVYLATGLTLGNSTRIEGIEKNGYRAMDLLTEIMAGRKVHLEPQVVVIGGGNVAFDIARSLARLQRKEYGKVDVTVMSLEGECELPADEEEKVEGGEEGVTLLPSRSPREILLDEKGKVRGVKTVRCLCVFDPDGKFNPHCDLNDVLDVPALMVVEAVGQRADYSYLGKFENEIILQRGKISTDENGQVENLEWLFAGGDIVHGPDVIHGIADGHRAAKGIDDYLQKK